MTERVQVARGLEQPGPHSGNLVNAQEVFARVSPGSRERPWSASALERAAACGFRYLAESTWRAQQEDEPLDEASPMETGRLAHLAAEHAVRAIVSAGLWTRQTVPKALEIGLAAAVKALDAEEPATVVGHPELWAITRERMLARLRRLLELEIERTARAGMTPMAYELSFGLPRATLPAVKLAGVFFAGQVDRIDVGPASVSILDYKSGRTDANARKYDVEKLLETQFQLPLYVAALSRVLPQADGRVVDAGYISLRDAQRTLPLSEILRSRMVGDVTEALEGSLKRLLGRLSRGDFAIAPKSCSGCHLRPVCRVPQREERP